MRGRRLLSLEGQFGRDLDGRFQRPVDRAALGKHAVHPLRGFLLLGTCLQAQHDMYAADDQHSILGLNFAGCIGRQLSRGSIDLTRFQRASESSRQSTRRGRDDIIQCGRVGLEASAGTL